MRFAACLALGMSLSALGPPAPAAARPQIWFGADDPWVRNWKHRAPNDYMALFTGDDAWAKGVNVLELSGQFALWGDEGQVKTVIAFAKAHNIKLAAVGLVVAKHADCGAGLEGYSSARGVENELKRFKSLGGELSYLIMDEPVYYGSVYPLQNACQIPIPELAAEIAERVKQIRAVYPSIIIGEDEVLGLADKFDWVPTLARWLDAYRSATGEPLAFLHLDVGWPSPRWPAQLRALVPLVRSRGVKLGAYYNGDMKDPDDATWSAHAVERAGIVEKDMGVRFDQAVIQSWMPHPDAMLPPTDPSTLTGVLRCYLAMYGAPGGACPR